MNRLIPATMDGNEAAAYASYAFTEVAAIYPITPSSPMAEHVNQWAATGKKNIFGKPVELVEMQSEAGAIAAVHGAMEAGVLTSTYTASQGLLLMIPTMNRIVGHLKPGVIHVASRSAAQHAYSINAEHSDVMACRQTGYVMLASSSVQQAMDLGAVAHLASIRSSLPFMHFFDGFRTSHEIQKINCLDYDDLAALVDYDALRRFRKNALHPEHPLVRNSGQSPEFFFQSREACNPYYDAVPAIVEDYMQKINTLTGQNYHLFNYYGAPDAEVVMVAIGSVCGAARESVEYWNRHGKRLGFLEVHLYRPFSIRHFLDAIPQSARIIVALDRTKENGALADPLYADVCTAFQESQRAVRVLAGRYGIGGKDTGARELRAIIENAYAEQPMNHFTVGIVDDVTHHSLPIAAPFDIPTVGMTSCKFWGLGSDGTVGANKNTVKIIGDHTDLYVQAYFEYDGKKSGGVTKSHLRFGSNPILSSCYVTRADFVACHQQTYLHKYDMYSDLKPGGAFLLNTSWTGRELEENLPTGFRRYLVENQIRFFTIDATAIARELGMGNHTNTILQAAFFRITGILPMEEAIEYMKQHAYQAYSRKGEAVVQKNYAAIERGARDVAAVVVPAVWAQTVGWEPKETQADLPEYVRTIMKPILAQKGSELPVSVFQKYADGSMPVGTSKYERRGIAAEVPCWLPENCIGCNQCAYVCPHATIRPFLLTHDELEHAPTALETLQLKGLGDYRFRIQVDPVDCTGCGSCASVCPARGKALVMRPLQSQLAQMPTWDYLVALPERNPEGTKTVRGSQFAKPLLEFPGACPGCGETPYMKLVTQLFGERMYVATATGCSLVWATDYPAAPYTVTRRGRGPAMSNSLFENNGEFGFGMVLGIDTLRDRLRSAAERLISVTQDEHIRTTGVDWLAAFSDGETTLARSDAFRSALEKTSVKDADTVYLLDNAEHLAKKSVWVLGGDGWAYDIGYGGLDHILAAGKDVNILVVDTEVYSNTGGQASKATAKGAVAQFAVAGRQTQKKDLGMMAMAYGNVYVAQVAMGANRAQLLKALREAEAYPGPSLVIAYAPCQSHGLKCGMANVQQEMKRAVDSGYWKLYRYDPRRKANGQNPLVLDSGEPTMELCDFMRGEVRFASLEKTFPTEAERLFREASIEAKEQFEKYRQLAQEGTR